MMSIPAHFGRPIEPRIRPLVEALNVPGMSRTLASCEGHRRWLGVRPPYVYFQAKTPFVSVLNRLVYNDLCRESPALRYPWHVRGMFNERDELCFSLAVPEMERHPVSLRSWLTWSRSDLDADFATLRGLVRETLAEIRKNGVPEIEEGSEAQSQDEKHSGHGDESLLFLCAHSARWIRGPAYGAFQRRSAYRCLAVPAFYQRHDSSPSVRDKGIHSISNIEIEGAADARL